MSIIFERDGAIGFITLNRPDKLNAMTHEMGDALKDLVPKLNADRTVRCVILRGAGRAFSAGGDLDFLEKNTRQDAATNEAEMLDFYTKFLSIGDLDMPSIALLHGRSTGAGLCLALACDLRITTHDAMLSLNFVRLGLTPGMAGTWNLPRLIGPARAAELILSGRTLTGTEAATIGLVNASTAPDQLQGTGLALARSIAEAAPLAVRASKQMLKNGAILTLPEALRAEARAQAEVFASADLQEGIQAIRDRRSPHFHGT